MLVYKTDILNALKQAGYTTYVIRRDNIMSESVLTRLRAGSMISMNDLDKLCTLLNCQPADLIEYKQGE